MPAGGIKFWSQQRGIAAPSPGPIPGPSSRRAGRAWIQTRLFFVWAAPTHADRKILSWTGQVRRDTRVTGEGVSIDQDSLSRHARRSFHCQRALEQTLKGWITTCLYRRGWLCTARRSYGSEPGAIRTKESPTHCYTYWSKGLDWFYATSSLWYFGRLDISFFKN